MAYNFFQRLYQSDLCHIPPYPIRDKFPKEHLALFQDMLSFVSAKEIHAALFEMKPKLQEKMDSKQVFFFIEKLGPCKR